jgi:hypothetical protein
LRAGRFFTLLWRSPSGPRKRRTKALRRFLAAIAVVIAVTGVSAHRRDEYLQAARVAIEPSRVELELDLTPGIAVAEAIIADIDRDRDGALSPQEKRAYVRLVMSAMELAVDGLPLQLEPLASTFPDLRSFRRGDGTIQLQSAVVLPPVSDGDHQLSFRNTYRRDVSVYLANALAPESQRVMVTAQRRDPDQRDLTIDYFVRADPTASLPVWPLGVIGVAVVAAARLIRGSKPHDVEPAPGV